MTESTRTVVFIGVTTGGSAVRKVFPQWMDLLGVRARLETVDIQVGASREEYRTVIEAVRDRSDVIGAQITAHKTAVFDSAHDLFTDLSHDADRYGEVSVVTSRGGTLTGTIVEPVTIGQTLRQLGDGRSITTDAADLVLYGAGGTAVSFLACLTAGTWPDHERPRIVHLVDIDDQRLQRAVRIAAGGDQPLTAAPHLSLGHSTLADLGVLPRGSVVVNATGLGKDRPGTPFTLPARWPAEAHAWDLNYRGNLLMLDSVRRADPALRLHAHDGWQLFINGWAESLSLILDRPIGPEDRNRMNTLASTIRN